MRRAACTWTALLCGLALLPVGGCEEVRARHRIQEGNKAYYAGDYDQAIREYDLALAVHPELAVAWYNLALAHLAEFAPGLKDDRNEAHAQGAIGAFARYLALEPRDTRARDFLLSTYIDSGHFEGALGYFEERLGKNPKDVEAMAQLAQINTQAGRFDEAIAWHHRRAAAETSIDARADAFYSIGVLDWRRLYKKADVVGARRVELVDDGLGALMRADTIRPNHGATLTYINLLYRERALAHDASYARAVDEATALAYMKRAAELAKGAAKPAEKPSGKP